MEGYSFNQIAKDYHLKRRKPWKPLEVFLNFVINKGYSFNGIILDLGCANGRNFKILGSYPKKIIGIDISLNLLKIVYNDINNLDIYSKSESKLIQVLQADIRYLPFKASSAQNIFSIATIHHVKNRSDRKKLFNDLFKITKNGGNIVITIWRKWQKKYRSFFILDWLKRSFSLQHNQLQKNKGLEEFGDIYVPWTLSKEKKVYHRFYHFFSKHEIKKLLRIFTVKEFRIMGGPTERDNFFILAQKIGN